MSRNMKLFTSFLMACAIAGTLLAIGVGAALFPWFGIALATLAIVAIVTFGIYAIRSM